MDAQGKYAEHLEEAYKLLPTWFVGRMMDDNWHFALILSTGHALYVENIRYVRRAADNSIWIDAHLYSQKDADTHSWQIKDTKLIGAPTSRGTVSINAEHVVYAVEMADT
jgi:arginase family enzyme